MSIEPIDAPYTFGDTEGAVREAHYARRLGYQPTVRLFRFVRTTARQRATYN